MLHKPIERIVYNSAVGTAWKEEMLTVKYREKPAVWCP